MFHATLCRASHWHVPLRCASSGHIDVNLYNIQPHPRATPLLLYLPPAGAGSDIAPSPPPAFLLDQPYCPLAVVHYRWSGSTVPLDARSNDPHGPVRQPHTWPTPLSDVLFAYDWLRRRLKRPVVVYGERLGATLALTLGLTETRIDHAHRRRRQAVHAVAAYNGVYHWPAFYDGASTALPDTTTAAWRLPPLDALFVTPADLLDPFASPTCFFQHRRGLPLPPTFVPTPAAVAGRGLTDWLPLESTGRSLLYYHPKTSRFALPATLLLHDHGSPGVGSLYPHTTAEHNSYAAQAAELAALMQRNVRHILLRVDKGLPDPGGAMAAARTALAKDQVRHVNVGPAGGGSLSATGQRALLAWLAEQVAEPAVDIVLEDYADMAPQQAERTDVWAEIERQNRWLDTHKT